MQGWYKAITGWLDGIWKRAQAFFNWVTGSVQTIQKQEGAAPKAPPKPALDPSTGQPKELVEMLLKEGYKADQIKKMLGGGGASIADTKPAPAVPWSSGLPPSPKSEGAISGVSGGGVRHQTINITKLVESITIQSNTAREAMPEVERVVVEALLRVVNGAGQ